MVRISALAMVLLASAPAAAQAPATPAANPNLRTDVAKTLDQNFDKSDVNNDGFLSDEEVRRTAGQVGQQMMSRLDQEFDGLDKDKNGQLSKDEFRAMAAPRMAQMSASALPQLDANKDGKVSPAEFNGPALAAFDRIDTNKDGTISPEEKQKAAAR
jgi:hypothetical protein